MRNFTLSILTILVLASFLGLQSCKDDSYLLKQPGVPDQSFSEEFDTASAAIARGWSFINVSDPIGGGVWQQGGGIPPWYPAYSSQGSYVGFIGADYRSVLGGPGTISNWLVSPPVTMQNGDKIVFYTRGWVDVNPLVAGDSTDWANRLQLLINPYNDGLDVGHAEDPGDFTTTLIDINSNYEEFHTTPSLSSPRAYPGRWTRFEGTVYGLNGPVRGRFAFRYFVENAGLCGTCLGTGVAIDKVSFVSMNHQ
jgi:hypothetical protein